MEGMAVVILASGKTLKIPEAPNGFPQCGDFFLGSPAYTLRRKRGLTTLEIGLIAVISVLGFGILVAIFCMRKCCSRSSHSNYGPVGFFLNKFNDSKFHSTHPSPTLLSSVDYSLKFSLNPETHNYELLKL
jgi:hypothetical protein